jgi:tetratricopeptide (TPR) repeat protein
LDLLRNLTAGTVVSAEAWSLLAKLSSDLNEQIHALEKLLELEPGDAQAGQELQRLRHFQNNPMDLAAMYEERGELDKAITTYGLASMNPKSRGQWESIYWKIARLENLRQEKIAHISPSISVARLTAGPPVLYLSLMLVQVGINPFAEPDPILWLGLLWVLLGALMVALAAVRSRHRLWFLLFKDLGAGGSPAARMLVSLAGWILILLPHVLLVLVAYDRLIDSIVLWIQ